VRTSECIQCSGFPCSDVNQEGYIIPDIEVVAEDISLVLISEAAPPERDDYYYAGGESLFEQTTVQAFQQAGADVASIQDVLDLGVYLTTAVKCIVSPSVTGLSEVTEVISTGSHGGSTATSSVSVATPQPFVAVKTTV